LGIDGRLYSLRNRPFDFVPLSGASLRVKLVKFDKIRYTFDIII